MTVHRCNYNIRGTFNSQCRDVPEWVLSPAGEQRIFVCEQHLPRAENEYPEAIILPLDTENH